MLLVLVPCNARREEQRGIIGHLNRALRQGAYKSEDNGKMWKIDVRDRIVLDRERVCIYELRASGMNKQYGAPGRYGSAEQLRYHNRDTSRHIEAYLGHVGPWNHE